MESREAKKTTSGSKLGGGEDVAPDMYLRRGLGGGRVALLQVFGALVQPPQAAEPPAPPAGTRPTLRHSHRRTPTALPFSFSSLVQTHTRAFTSQNHKGSFSAHVPLTASRPLLASFFSFLFSLGFLFFLSVEYFPSQLNLGFLTGSWALDTGNKK